MQMYDKTSCGLTTRIPFDEGQQILNHYQGDGSRFVKSLTREPSGAYVITLKRGEEIRLVEVEVDEGGPLGVATTALYTAALRAETSAEAARHLAEALAIAAREARAAYEAASPRVNDAELRTADVLRQNEARRAAMGLTDDSDEDDEQGCEGHYDDDHALTSGVGIGEPTYCDGSCRPRR